MKVADPGLFALKAAARTAIVVPVALAIGLVAIGDDQVGLFAAFGSFAFLVFADFGGPTKLRLGGYLGLAVAGAALIALGTLLSEHTALGTVAMGVLAFVVLFAGVLTGYVAAAQSAVLLSFVLPLMLPVSSGLIPERLAGWAIAAALSIAATMLLWPGRPRDAVRSGAALAAEAIANLIEAGEGERGQELDAAAERAVSAVRGEFVSIQHRPSGAGGRTAALARLLEELSWIRRFARPRPGSGERSASFAVERAEIEREVPLALRRCAEWLRAERSGEPELEALRRAHGRLGEVALADVGRLAGEGPGAEGRAARELDEVFRLRLLAFAAIEIATTARRALGARAENPFDLARDRVEAAGRVARAHASMRSVWLRNSLRGALGLALAVLIAELAAVDNAFWVVLGTMSVLRSSALATGSTIARALLGTLAGIVVGGALLVAVEGSEAALWVLLPLATLLAAYSPRAISFAAGQAGFSVVVLILFNLLEPVGWEVGLARIEDVAIGGGVSLVVGALFWPRGATAVLRQTIGAAYQRSAAYLEATLGALLAGERVGAPLAREAFSSGQVLDATIRDFLSDRSGANAPIEELTVLQAGARRLRQIANLLGHQDVLVRVEPVRPGLPRADVERRELETERDTICAWFAALGSAVAADGEPPAATTRAAIARRPVVLEREGDGTGTPPGVAIAWAGRYLDVLASLEPLLVGAAERVTRDDRPAGPAA